MEHKKQHKMGAMAEGCVLPADAIIKIALAVIIMITVLGLYALYKGKNIEVETRADGSAVLRTK